MKIKKLNFVRNFLVIALVTITIVIGAVFINFHFKAEALTHDILLQQGRALFSEIVMIRRWVSQHGGVFVEVKEGVNPNPFLTTLPDLKVNIKDEDGTSYTLLNPGLVVKGISELSEKSGQFRFHIASLKPINESTNSPDDFERKALESFESGEKEAFTIEPSEGGAMYRYMAPLVYEQQCNKCHGFQNYDNGDIRGGISVSIPMTMVSEKLEANRTYILTSALVLGILLVFLFALSNKFMKKLDEAQAQLLVMATTDGLTKVYNRKAGIERFEEEISQHNRFNKPLSCLLLDIDHFKSINDRYGHQAGDAFLVMLAGILRKFSRQYDIVCRYGGEEFIIILPETDLVAALFVAEKMREQVQQASIVFNNSIINTTISIGAVQMFPGKKESSDDIIFRADKALYKAKETGRNRVITAEETENFKQHDLMMMPA
jgi:diguanylate cyclase (GGDEF)-like protein